MGEAKRRLTMVVGLGTASLGGGFAAEKVAEIIKLVPKLTDGHRAFLKNHVVCGLRTNKHIDDNEEAGKMLSSALSLALSSEMGNVLRLMDLSGATLAYEITPLPTPNDYNWRLMVSRPTGNWMPDHETIQ